MSTPSQKTPHRVQRKRIKGWKMPPNTVSVTRPGKWGNPFKVVGEEGHWFVVNENDEPIITFERRGEALDCCLGNYKEYISHEHNLARVNVFELKGKNLACFCPLDQPCHADILLELANSK